MATECGFTSLRGGERKSSAGGGGGCFLLASLDRIALWLGSGVAACFFASLERCACINISTTDMDDPEDANDVPLISSIKGNYLTSDGSKRRSSKKTAKKT
ncbi:hypothetical protein AMTRI_Chr09g19900 [Amborella trichopoda]|uniref:Uncharacterized protein n=1 Tax=Amborella trichopoda TaxID=13333 RepID=W1PPI9_AMBTC|nr:hypothetical protein AMTR_s00287p00011420 [Amborella trichopoda]